MKWTVPLDIKGDMIIKISNERKKVYICSTEGYIWTIELKTGRLLWKHKEDWSPDLKSKSWPDNVPNFFEMEIINNYIYIVGKYINENGEWYNSTFFIFDSENGNLVQKIEYPNKRISLNIAKNKIFILDIDNKTIQQFKARDEK